MYKKTASKHHFLRREGSHSTKPKMSMLSGSGVLDISNLAFIARMPYEEARDEQAKLREEYAKIITTDKSQLSEDQRKSLGVRQSKIGAALSALKKRLGDLHQVADAANDYKCLMQAAEDLFGREGAAQLAMRKSQIQTEVIGSIEALRPTSSGRKRKPVDARSGGTLEQIAARFAEKGWGTGS